MAWTLRASAASRRWQRLHSTCLLSWATVRSHFSTAAPLPSLTSTPPVFPPLSRTWYIICAATTQHITTYLNNLHKTEYRVSASLIFRQSAYFKIAISLKTFLRTSVLYKIYDYMKTYTKSTIWYTHYTLYEDAMIIRVIRRIAFQSFYLDFALIRLRKFLKIMKFL